MITSTRISFVLSIFCLSAALAADYSIATYGAVPNDSLNDWTAIQNTINAARPTVSRIIFPTGVYHLNQTLKVAPAVSGGLCNLTFEGQGSTLIFTNWVIAFSVSNCNGLVFRNFSIDYNPLPFTLGKVIALDTTSVTFDVAIDTRSNNALTDPVQAYFTYNVNKRRPAITLGDSGSSDSTIRSVDVYQLDANTPSLVLKKNSTTTVLRVRSLVGLTGVPYLKGQYVIMRYKVYHKDAFQIASTKNVWWSDIYIYSAPGMGINSFHCTNMVLDRFFLLRKSGRPMSTCADGVHFTNPRGTLVIKNSVFEGQGDDAVNIHNTILKVNATGQAMRLYKASGANEFPDAMWAGDQISFGSPNDPFHPYLVATVKTVQGFSSPRYGYNVTFNENVSSVTAGSIAMLETISSAYISNSKFRSSRGRGVLVNNRNTVVEGCTFDQTSGPAIIMDCETTKWLEGNCARNVVVRNNRIVDCNYQFKNPGLILLRSRDYSNKAYLAGVFKNITMTGNVFLGPNSGSFFNLGSTSNATISNNFIANNQTTGTSPIISLCNSINVLVSGNTLTSQAQFLAIDPSCTGQSTYSANQAFNINNFDQSQTETPKDENNTQPIVTEDVNQPDNDEVSDAVHLSSVSTTALVLLSLFLPQM